MAFCYSLSKLRDDLRKMTGICTKLLKCFKFISHYSQSERLSPRLAGWLFATSCTHCALSCPYYAFQFVLFSLPKMFFPNLPLLAQRLYLRHFFVISASPFPNDRMLQSLFYYMSTFICISLYGVLNLVQGCRQYLLR